MIENNHFASEEIKKRLNLLKENWNQLKEKSSRRKRDLEDSLQAFNLTKSVLCGLD